LPEPVHEQPIRLPDGTVLRPDFCYPELKIAIECESYRWHGGRRAWLRDIERYALLRRAGWIVIQVTMEMIEPDPSHFLDDLRSYLVPRLFG
ncbi:MAG: hypothetical protein ACLGHL_06895, partial [Actinomycetota bacterium]